LIEPYFSGSHRSWGEGYQRHSKHDIHLLTLPGRFWKWRMFGGSLTLGLEAAKLASEADPPEVLLVSDMLDLPSFLGHAGRALGDPRIVLYMHENQLTYPLSPTARDDLAYAYMNWSSMVRADEVWFNSRFHIDSVFEALPGFLRHFPDHRHSSLVADVAEKSRVMPVGVDLSWVTKSEKTDPPLIVWNQRWEYDKDPVRLFDALYRLAGTGAAFRLALCGENFRNVPEEFEVARERLAGPIVQYGHAERDVYEALLIDASIVPSTAKHEFFGVGAVEAMAAGAVPVFPRNLSYPELIPDQAHDQTLYESDEELDTLLSKAVQDRAHLESVARLIAPSMERFSWARMASVYDTALSG
jgi:glycosyltransferase involved in cell wall biosynthesis